MSEFPPAQFQDPDPERAAAFEEWSQFQPPAVFVNYRTACHRAFIAGYNTHRPHIEALEKLVIEWGRGLDVRDVHPLDRALVVEAHRLAALARKGEEAMTLLRPQDSFPKEMWIEYASAVERERDEALAEVEFQMQHSLTSWVLDAVLRLGWKPPALARKGEEAMRKMTPDEVSLAGTLRHIADDHPCCTGSLLAAVAYIEALEGRVAYLEGSIPDDPWVEADRILVEVLEQAHNAAEAWGEAISMWGPHDERTTAALVAWDIARAALAKEKRQ